MWRYFIKRLLTFIPTIIIITLLAFIISVNAPGDATDRLVNVSQEDNAAAATLNARKAWREQLGLDLPLFYFSIHPLAYCDTLNRILDASERTAISNQISVTGNNQPVENFHHLLHLLMVTTAASKSTFINDTTNTYVGLINGLTTLQNSSDKNTVLQTFKDLDQLLMPTNYLAQRLLLQTAKQRYLEVYKHPTLWKNYIPVFHFQIHNQYHRWLFGDGNVFTGKGAVYSRGLIRGDFGISYATKDKVQTLIGQRLSWSLFFSICSILAAYLISIPLGVFAAVQRGRPLEKIVSLLTFLLPAMPTFWVATVLLMTFANPAMLQWFPASGVAPTLGYKTGSSFWSQALQSLPHLILPFICYTYGTIAFLSRIVRVGMLDSLAQDYIRTARAKGLSESTVIWKHAFRNSLLPLITVFANVFPAVIGGSVILETIFTIPGMGSLIYQAIGNQDYPVIIAVFTLTGLLTMVGYLISDLLYAWADPRIKFK